MNIVRSTEALDEFKHRLVSSPKRNTIHTHHHSYHTNTDCMYLKKRAYSLTNSNVITQFELENQLNSQIHKIYGSSKEFLANLDQTSLIGTKHEADFATSHNFLTNIENKEFRDLPLPARKDSNVNIKILDKIHTHQNDNILTVFAVLSYLLVINLRYWIIFFVTFFVFIIYYMMRFLFVATYPFINIGSLLISLPVTISKTVLNSFLNSILYFKNSSGQII